MVNPNACEICLELEGKTVDLGEAFADKGDEVAGLKIEYETVEHPPIHNNCRCILAPVFISGKQMKGKIEKEIAKMKKQARENEEKYCLEIEHSHKEQEKKITEVKQAAVDEAVDKILNELDG